VECLLTGQVQSPLCHPGYLLDKEMIAVETNEVPYAGYGPLHHLASEESQCSSTIPAFRAFQADRMCGAEGRN
jgi:hypothetical protein